MKTCDRQKLRIAHAIRRQLQEFEDARVSELTGHSDVLLSSIRRFDVLRRQLDLCHRRGWLAAAAKLRVNGIYCLRNLRPEIDLAERQFDYTPSALPSLRDLLDDLEQLEDEFPRWRYDRSRQTLSVTTEPIELEEVYLGPFEIILEIHGLAHLSQREALVINPLDPHPAGGSDHIPHPHVSDGRLCAGEASTAIRSALEAGRISDFFLLVRSVLTTYNADSPYVSLDSWHGEACADCGYRTNEDGSFWCEACDRQFCDDCMGRCENCDTNLCRGCLSECKFCEESICRECFVTCAQCGTSCCKSCLNEDLCPDCKYEQEQDHEQEREESPSVAPALPPAPGHGPGSGGHTCTEAA